MANIIHEIDILTLQEGFNKVLERYGGEIVKHIRINEISMDINEAIYYKGRFDLVVKRVLGMDMQFLPLLLKINNLRSITDYNGNHIVKYFDQNDVTTFLESNNIL